jgi:hypothetical protein
LGRVVRGQYWSERHLTESSVGLQQEFTEKRSSGETNALVQLLGHPWQDCGRRENNPLFVLVGHEGPRAGIITPENVPPRAPTPGASLRGVSPTLRGGGQSKDGGKPRRGDRRVGQEGQEVVREGVNGVSLYCPNGCAILHLRGSARGIAGGCIRERDRGTSQNREKAKYDRRIAFDGRVRRCAFWGGPISPA